MMICFEIPKLDHPLHDVIQQLAPYLDFDNGPWIAGGSLRRLIDGDLTGYYDVDLFVKDDTQLPKLRLVKNKILEKYDNSYAMPSHIKYPKIGPTQSFISIQVIKDFMFDDAQKLIDDFDFSVCQFVSDGKFIWTYEKSLSDLKQKRLSLNPWAKIRNKSRVLKYCARGFIPDNDVAERTKSSIGEYYHGEGLKFFRLADTDLECDISEEIILSKLIGCTFANYNGDEFVFLGGYPFPISLGYLWVSTKEDRLKADIRALLKDFWKQHNLDEKDIELANNISFEYFLENYKSRSTSAILPAPSNSETTDSSTPTTSSVSNSSVGSLSSLTKLLTLIAIICSLIFAITKLLTIGQ